MPAVFEQFGVRLLYPENWSFGELELDEWPRSVTLQSPNTAFWTLHVYPPFHETDEPVNELIAAIGAEFGGELEVLPAKETFGDTAAAGFDIAFFWLDLLVEAKIRFIHTPSATLLWHYQAESREFEAIEPVFQAIAVSMLKTQVAISK